MGLFVQLDFVVKVSLYGRNMDSAPDAASTQGKGRS